jgi:hypothetical protein
MAYCKYQRPERCALTRLRYSPMPVYYKAKQFFEQPAIWKEKGLFILWWNNFRSTPGFRFATEWI